MKKIVWIFLLLVIISCAIPVNCEASADELSWNNVKSTVDGFFGKVHGSESNFNASGIVSTVAGILTTIGVLIVLGGLLVFGIKYMTSSPDDAAKIKTKLIGLVIAGIVILGAYGIWMILGNIFEGMTMEIQEMNVIPHTTSTPTPEITATPEVTPEPTPEKDLGEEYVSSFSYGNKTIEYWASIPNNKTVSSYNGIPLIIYLHGRNEGASISAVQNNGFPSYIKNKSVTPKAMVVAPRFPNSVKQWTMPPSEVYETVKQAIADAKSKGITIDESNISITGFSMGGAGAYDAIKEYPDLFSRAVLVSPQDNTNDLHKVKCQVRVYFESIESASYRESWKKATGNAQYSNIYFEILKYGFHGDAQKIYFANETDSLAWLSFE